jgi:hypothetical protein
MSPSAQRKRRPSTSPSSEADEALQLLMQLLHSCGYSGASLKAAALKAVPTRTQSARAKQTIDRRYYRDAPHVITHWYQDPTVLDRHGEPLALPLLGESRSIAALVNRVNPELDPKVMIAYLVHVKGITKTKTGWAPTRRDLSYVADPGSLAWHALESVLGLLRNTGHNLKRPRQGASWLEARMTSGTFPAAILPRIDQRARALGNDYLVALDREIQAEEIRTPRPRSRSVRVGVGTYFYVLPSSHGPQTTRKR